MKQSVVAKLAMAMILFHYIVATKSIDRGTMVNHDDDNSDQAGNLQRLRILQNISIDGSGGINSYQNEM